MRRSQIGWPKACVGCGATSPFLKKYVKKETSFVDLQGNSVRYISTKIHAYLCKDCFETSKLIKKQNPEMALSTRESMSLLIYVMVPILASIVGVLSGGTNEGYVLVLFFAIFWLLVAGACVIPGIMSKLERRRNLISPYIRFSYSSFGINPYTLSRFGKQEPYFIIRNPVFFTMFQNINPGLQVVLNPDLQDEKY